MLNLISGMRFFHRKSNMEMVRVIDPSTGAETTANYDMTSSMAPGMAPGMALAHHMEPSEEVEENDVHKVHIPISLTCLLLISYVFMGTINISISLINSFLVITK